MNVEVDDSTPNAGRLVPVPMAGAACATANGRPRAVLSPGPRPRTDLRLQVSCTNNYKKVMQYSLSFDFGELRFCHVAVHTACEGAGDARGCPRAAGRCATWCDTPQERRRHAQFCAQHAQRCDMALRTTAVSGEPNQPFADRVSVPTIGTTFLARADSSVLISVLRFLRAIDFEMVGVERG